MQIKLPGIEPFDTLDLPADFEDRIKESFQKCNNSRNDRYTWKNKMAYISTLPLYFKNGTLSDDAFAKAEVKKVIHDRLDHSIDGGYDIFDREDIYSFNVMLKCFWKGLNYRHPLGDYEPYSSSKNDETEKVMFRIMQIVMSWEPEAENDEV